MTRLINNTEVLEIAFNKNVRLTKITTSLIETAQYKYLKPVLGEDLFEAVLADPLNANFAALILLVKQMLAWWIKYLILPEIFVEIGDTGIKYLETDHTTQVSSQRFIELRESTRTVAEDKTKQLTDYLNDEDTDLSDYSRADNVDHTIQISGGIIHRRDTLTTREDDCPEKWR